MSLNYSTFEKSALLRDSSSLPMEGSQGGGTITISDYKLIMGELEQRISRRRHKMTREQEFVIVGTLIAGFTFNILAQKNSNLEAGYHSADCDWYFSLTLGLVGTINMVYVVFATLLCFKGAKVFSFRVEKKEEFQEIFSARNLRDISVLKDELFHERKMIARISRTKDRILDFDNFWSEYKESKKLLRFLFAISCILFLVAMILRPSTWKMSTTLGLANLMIYGTGVVSVMYFVFAFHQEVRM